MNSIAGVRYRKDFRQSWVKLWILFRIQFSFIRDRWMMVIIMATMFPLTTLMFMNFFTVDPTPEMLVKLIAGNMIFAIIIMGMNMMAQDISWQKHQGHFVFYASLPISKFHFVIANLLRAFLSTFPSVIILAALGRTAFGVEFHYSWGLVPVLMLSILSIIGIGVMLGFWSPNHQLLNMASQFLMNIVSFLTPVFIEMHQLPVIMRWISYLLPTTYAAQALKDMLLVGWTEAVTVSVAVMSGFAVLSIFLIYKLIHWRVDS
ncbi:ABC transporter permease [Paenibacillus alkalitolerans]|uniref:ABC transporter permease n=1 Tax=Paenibacillus alkalitolerans TaxID=2799335 RepID=UPI0018F6098F|nr:ABC transporter permease [Paenibacillus alkalitolerans]